MRIFLALRVFWRVLMGRCPECNVLAEPRQVYTNDTDWFCPICGDKVFD